MSFLTWAALAIALLVAAPVAAHLLRRRRSQPVDFPGAQLVPQTRTRSRNLGRLEDRPLFALRAAAILALALLGASPLVRCSRLTLERDGGASVALVLVLDDSMSMQGTLDGRPDEGSAPTRFERARGAADQLLSETLAGDSVALVLAGRPARIALAPTTDAVLARSALGAVEVSDRGTDLEGALRLGRSLLANAAQPSRRLVLLSDLAGEAGGEETLTPPNELPAWQPELDLRPRGADCALREATLTTAQAEVDLLCTSAEGSTVSDALRGRRLTLRRDWGEGEVVGELPLPPPGPDPVWRAHLTWSSPGGSIPAPEGLAFRLEGPGDTQRADDLAPVLPEGERPAVGLLLDAARLKATTGGPLPLEQALNALGADLSSRALTSLPETAEELRPFGALLLDDPPGFTPEGRRALGTWIEGGGVVLLTLGPRAGTAPLGYGFEPLLRGTVRWTEDLGGDAGASPEAVSFFGPAGRGLSELEPRGRAVLDGGGLGDAEILTRWTSGAPLLLRRRLGRGWAYVCTLPLDTAVSDLTLRPAFLRLLDRVLESTRARSGTRIEAGQTWAFEEPTTSVRTLGPRPGQLALEPSEQGPKLSPGRAGLYEVRTEGARALRAVDVPADEVNLRARVLPQAAGTGSGGQSVPPLDVSAEVAWALLGLGALELGLRLRRWRRARTA